MIRFLATLTGILTFALAMAMPAFGAGIISNDVQGLLRSASLDSTVEFILSFDKELDLTALKMTVQRNKLDREETYRHVMSRLITNRESLKTSLRPVLDRMNQTGQVSKYTFFTAANAVCIKGTVSAMAELMNQSGLRLVNLNLPVSLIQPVEMSSPSSASPALANSALETMQVRSLWNLGLTGSGTVICSFDTGVDGDHPALGSKWRGNYGYPASACWFAPHGGSLPDDRLGHGSHVMGVMVGSNGIDTIGVAPDARWISAAVIDQGVSFSTTIADILSAFDWALNPDGNLATTDDVPDVICNSWGVPKGVFGDCDNTFWSAIDNVEAAGIIAIFAAGNEGPNPETIRNPADRASSPLNSFCVGAIDQNTQVIADFSSRGPASCDNTSKKPEVVAPGVGIYSSYKDGTYKIMSGTSMAAPFIAGLAALMRQYNPEATVAEIKSALNAAASDLGPAGEDNAYGHGLVDASRLLNFVSPPPFPPIEVFAHQMSAGGDSIADPGESGTLSLTLRRLSGLSDSVDVTIQSRSTSLIVSSDAVRYRFTPNGFAYGLESFQIQIAPEAISGSTAALDVYLTLPYAPSADTIEYHLAIGRPVPGTIFEITSGNLAISASDFGQFGFGMGSIYQAGGAGVRFSGGANLLFEAGLVAAVSPQFVADGIRGSDGYYKESDFTPLTGAGPILSADGALTTDYHDGNASLPIPVHVTQSIYQTGHDYVIVEFTIQNPSPERLAQLSFGLFADFDINGASDQIGFDTALGLIYQYDENAGLYVGMTGVSPHPFAYRGAVNDNGLKAGFSEQQKFDLVSGSGISLEPLAGADWYFTVSRTVSQLEAFGTRTMAVALTAGNSLTELRANAEMALAEYGNMTDIDDDKEMLPTSFELAQNFPNPFNPQTTISFRSPSAAPARLEIFNVAGQKVRLLFDNRAMTGEQSFVWDGCDNNGVAVPSGIYFYRLTAPEWSETKKMMLLK